jgi:aminobutyraldehyde dehydrogenase
LVAGTRQSDEIVQREVFGPVVSLTRFTDADDAVAWANTHFTLVSEMPHGGFKRSGYGKDLSAYALEDYTVPRHVMVTL